MSKLTKETIKKLMKEILLEDTELSLNKEINKKISKVNKDQNKIKNFSFKELIQNTSLDIPLISNYDFQQFNKLNILKDLEENEQEVQKFIKLKKEYPNLERTHFDIESYYIKKNYLEDLRLLISTIEEFKVKIDLILMGRNPLN